MGLSKIVRLVAVLFAVVAGLIDVPQAAAIIAVLGLIGGWFVESERWTYFLVATLALNVVPGAMSEIPAIGVYLTDVLESLSVLFNAAACMVIVRAIVEQLKP